MDITVIERDFIDWLSEKISTAVDYNIFRGGIPIGVDEGIGVRFDSEIPQSGYYKLRPKTWNVIINAKFRDRDHAMILQTMLSEILNCHGFSFGSTKFISVAQSEGSESPHQEDDNGEVKTFMLFKMRVSVLTSGTQDRM